jgi:hypothetical protein
MGLAMGLSIYLVMYDPSAYIEEDPLFKFPTIVSL